MSLHPIADKAEVSVDFPDKAYMGSFGRHSQFDAYADTDSVAIKLVRPGEDRREAVIHLHYGLLAEILTELARSLTLRDPLDDQHRSELSDATKQLAASLEPRDKNRGPEKKWGPDQNGCPGAGSPTTVIAGLDQGQARAGRKQRVQQSVL